MPVRPRTVLVLAAGLLAAAPLTACGGPAPEPDAPAAVPAATAPPSASGGPKAAARVLGGAGSACALPVSFALAEEWEPEAVKDPEDPEFAALTRQGPAIVRCEVDAKPSGNVGFLRVWTAKGPARAALEGFVKAEEKTTEVRYRATTAGALPAVEVTYVRHNALLGDAKEERAFAVAAPKGTVIVHLGGIDTEEHRAMLPAYELARTSLKPL